jgi:hypothetical protein
MQEFRATKAERLAYSSENYIVSSTTFESADQPSIKKTIDHLMVQAKRTTKELIESLWFTLTKKISLNL